MLIIPIAAVSFALLTLLAALCLRVLLLPRFRPALQLAGGTLLMGLLAGALGAHFGHDIPVVAAQETAGAAASTEPASESKPAAPISESTTEAPADSTETSPAEAAPTEASDPAAAQLSAASTSATSTSVRPATPPELEIDLDAAPATKPEDIKIERLPDGTFVIPAGRPQWVKDHASDPSGASDLSGPIHRVYVKAGPFKLPRDADKALDESLQQATEGYIADQIGSPLAAKVSAPGIHEIRRDYLKHTYEEKIDFKDELGLMEQRHSLLEFDQAFRDRMRASWAGRIAENRLYQVGLGAGAALLLLGSVFSYFRLDNATRGYYTGRLQFLTAAAILAIVALASAAAFQFTWL